MLRKVNFCWFSIAGKSKANRKDFKVVFVIRFISMKIVSKQTYLKVVYCIFGSCEKSKCKERKKLILFS